MDLRETYDLIAEDWHRDHQEDDWWVGGTRLFAARLRPGQSVLDAGCGSGIKSAVLREAGLDVTGIDISPKMIDIAKREYPGIDFGVLDMACATDLERTFDGVFAQASLLHVRKSDVPDVLQEWRLVLNPGGLIYVAVKGLWEGRSEEEIRREDDYGYAYERFFSYFSPEELQSFLEQAGFHVVERIVQRMSPDRTGWIQLIGRSE